MEPQTTPQVNAPSSVQPSKNWNSLILIIIITGIVILASATAVVFYAKNPKLTTITTNNQPVNNSNPFSTPTPVYQNPFDQTQTSQTDSSYQNPFSSSQ